ncbi:MAG TPA: VOC family protein [Actinomycetales bacterium]
MRVDHVSYAAESGGLRETAARLADALGVSAVDGGVHPRFGTRNMILPLTHDRYVEVVEVLDHPASDKAPFGQAVRARSADGGGWLGWVVAVDDMAPHEQRLGREAVVGSRKRPDGIELRWRQLGVKGLVSDPQLPFMIFWDGIGELHPSAIGPTSVTLESLQIAGDKTRVTDWLGLPPDYTSTEVGFDFVAPRGTPGLLSCTFSTPSGSVTV